MARPVLPTFQRCDKVDSMDAIQMIRRIHKNHCSDQYIHTFHIKKTQAHASASQTRHMTMGSKKHRENNQRTLASKKHRKAKKQQQHKKKS